MAATPRKARARRMAASVPRPTGNESDERAGRDDAGVLELVAQVGDQRRDSQLLAGDPLQQLARLEHAAVAMHVLAQPRAQRREVAALELLLDVRQIDADALPQLRGHQVADRVRR